VFSNNGTVTAFRLSNGGFPGKTNGGEMDVRRVLVTVIGVCALALGGGKAMADPVDCSTVNSIGEWADQGEVGCLQQDKLWVLNSTDIDDAVQTIFSSVTTVHAMQIVGFDNSDNAGTWNVNYTISVLDPAYLIIAMSAGADSPATGGGTTSLTKTVTGDPVISPFVLTVLNGVENAASTQAGLHATALTINESFTANADSALLSVSNTFIQARIPEPATLALLGIGLLGLGLSRKRRAE
jgi:hypothetical protein